MDNQPISRASVGRIACIGDLYDARSDNFCGISIFKSEPPENSVSFTDSPFSDIHLVHSDNVSEKFNKLEVAAELQVSVLAGLLKFSGSARYLQDKKQSARTAKSSLVYSIKTKKEQLNIYHEDLKDSFSLDAIETELGTHVVTGIDWGANSVLSCTNENRDSRDVKEIEGSLSAHMQKASFAISGNASVEFNEGDNSTSDSFEVRIYGDILPENEELPTTFEEALRLMKRLPKLVANYNDGKGKPLMYQMVPISLLQKYLNFEIQGKAVLITLAEASLHRVVQLFNQTALTQQQLHDFHQDALDSIYCVPAEDLDKVAFTKEAMTVQEATLRSNLSSTLTEIRRGEKDVSELEKLIAEFQSDEHSPLNVSTMLTNWISLRKKIKFAKLLITNGVKYIGRGTSLEEELLEEFESKSVILYFTESSRTTDSEIWKATYSLFFQEIKKNIEGYRYFAVDCDIYPDLMPAFKRSCIQILQNGNIITEDLFEEYAQKEKINWAMSTTATERLKRPPSKTVALTLPCPGNNCDPEKKYSWSCRKCGRLIDYGFDLHVYCRCGKSLAVSMEFRCSHPDHGLNYDLHDEEFLLPLLDELRPFPELNILILGETGVGKSTWINAFINFMTYDSIEDAQMGDLCTLIPSEFTICDDNFEEVLVRTGADTNEVISAGKSATQSTKVYPFVIGNKTIRLIDTPGIGDTRGIDKDKENFQNILGTLSHLDELHGICILLKPNSARLTVMFRFCIKELLTYLHRDASKNIVFCFTNSRGTFYRPGDTLPALKALLRENNEVEIPLSKQTVYCFDSEAYRFLAAVKNDPPVSFDETEKANFSSSWDKSIEETMRMLTYISSIKPHPIKNTLNLNTARELILSLTRPIAEITKNIQTNREILKHDLELIMNTNAEIDDLEKLRFVKKKVLKSKSIPYPKTVCANTDCINIWTEKEGDQAVNQYTQVCHERCYVQGVTSDIVGDYRLLHCYAMAGRNTCQFCSHSYLDHLHSYYDSYEATVMVEDKSVVAALNAGLSAKEMKENMMESKRQEIESLEEEQKIIEEASAKFACFLKQYALQPYNDAMESYLDHLIKQEEERVALHKDHVRLDGLKASLASYLAKKQILETAMDQDDCISSELTPEDIQDVVNMLKGLKAGESLENALKCVNAAREVVYQETVSSPQAVGQVNIIDKIEEDPSSPTKKGKKGFLKRFSKNAINSIKQALK